MEKTFVEVESHNDVSTGDYLVHISINGETKTKKIVKALTDYDARRAVSRIMPFYLIHCFLNKIEIKIVQYESPLRQRVVRKIEMN